MNIQYAYNVQFLLCHNTIANYLKYLTDDVGSGI
jgi:hypothetical protein